MDDIATIAVLEAAYDTAVRGAPYMDDAWIREDWTRDRFDPAVDSWLVSEAGGALAAYAQVCDEEGNGVLESLARVHPDHWGRGLGSALVELVEARAGEYLAAAPGGSVKLLNSVVADDSGAAALLDGAGYRIDRHFWHMELDLTRELPSTELPQGIELRGFDPSADAAIVHEVLENAFVAHYLYSPTPLDEWSKQLEKEWFDQDLWLVAVEGERVVGALTGRPLLGEGWVSELGVLAPWRGRGIAAALLARIFHIFKAHGFETAVLNVDAANETGATALYERVGMRVRLQWDLYAKTLER